MVVPVALAVAVARVGSVSVAAALVAVVGSVGVVATHVALLHIALALVLAVAGRGRIVLTLHELRVCSPARLELRREGRER